MSALRREQVGSSGHGRLDFIECLARDGGEANVVAGGQSSRPWLAAVEQRNRCCADQVPSILVGFVATLVYGGKLTLDGQMQAGAYGVLIFLTQRLLWPLTRVAETVDLYERAMASTRRILDLIETPFRIRSGERLMPVKTVRGEISFSDVTFSYASGPPVLRDLNLDIPAGQSIALVGQTGSGKSTLMKLLLRFYEPVRGTVCLDGVDLNDIALSDLRAAIGLVSQDVFLFHGSVGENIAYGRPDATEEDVVEAAKASDSHDFIMHLAQGYDTIVGERGQKLSGGQRQRISIARAVLKDPPVLILDEATSSVDNETEAAIQQSMKRIAQGRTTIVIAHRLSTIVDSDRIYVLENGGIAEQGDHDTLLKTAGIYTSLWQVQTGALAG